MTLGERIKYYRKKEGLSQEALAEKLNVSRQAITKWENDNGIPDIDNLIALSRIIGITIDELVMGENEENGPIISKESVRQRKSNSTIYLISVIGFSISAICWIVSCILNVVNGNELAAVLNVLCIVILSIPIGLSLRRYFEIKEQK